MLITKIPGYEWPMEVLCGGCSINLIITECKDIEFEKSYCFVPYFPPTKKLRYSVTCPICRSKTLVPASDIPERLLEHITR